MKSNHEATEDTEKRAFSVSPCLGGSMNFFYMPMSVNITFSTG